MERLANLTRSIERQRAQDALRNHPDAITIVRKSHAKELPGLEFVLSDETPDRVGDIIVAAGWQTANFEKNPIALFGHRADFPLGTWKNLRVEKTKLVGELSLAPPGTSDRIDEVRRLVEANILKAVSVGFRDIESVPIDPKAPYGGMRFTKSELVECSLVAVPANPNALAISKSLNISTDVQRLVFAEQGSPRRTGKGTRPISLTKADARRRNLVAEAERLLRLHRRQREIAADATDFVKFCNRADVRNLRNANLTGELTDALERLRAAEITGKATATLLRFVQDELRRIDRYELIMKRARKNIGDW